MAVSLDEMKTQMKKQGIWLLAEAPDVFKTRVRLAYPREDQYADAITRYETPQKFIAKDGVITVVQLTDQAWGGIRQYPEDALRFYLAGDTWIVVHRFERSRPLVEVRTFQVQKGTERTYLSSDRAMRVPHYETLDLFWHALIQTGFVTEAEVAHYRQVLVWDDLPRARLVAA